ncbi:hypothetical protein [Novosphingobium sp.]|uniref:hypothetical protein n=1 Tax=Novosphingobium sp. TaxID=1874826 RepID=UPI00286C17A8|nr:hypothetical protein [Novosphingobium sp.]
MPTISKIQDYDGFLVKTQRLDLMPLVEEAEQAILSFQLMIEELKHANGTKGIRQSIDQGFERAGGWQKAVTGRVDWRKGNERGASVGVEVQVSGRSDLLAVDVMHLKNDIASGIMDIGVIIVPDDKTSYYLTDRTPNFSTAIKHIELHASDLPIRVIAFQHDGVGAALAKMRTNLGRN